MLVIPLVWIYYFMHNWIRICTHTIFIMVFSCSLSFSWCPHIISDLNNIILKLCGHHHENPHPCACVFTDSGTRYLHQDVLDLQLSPETTSKFNFFLCVKPAHADIAENGYVNVLDARIILQAAAGRIEL